MRIALCLSGGLRNFKDTYYSFKEFLLDKHEVDVFFYGLENKEGKNQNESDLIQLYDPKSYVINTPDDYSQIPCPYDIKSSFYAFYNVLKCNGLKSEQEFIQGYKYDVVIRSRTDYFWFRELTNQELILAKDNILIPKEWAFKEVNDFARFDGLAIGNSNAMDIYSSLFFHIDEYCKGFKFHPESLCGYHLMTKNLSNVEIDRPVIFEYPSLRVEKYISPYKFTKYFEEPPIVNEDEFLRVVSMKRRYF